MKLFVRYFGIILILSSFFRIIPIIAAIFYEESIALFIPSTLLSIIIGAALCALGGKMPGEDARLSLSQALMLVASSFIILPLISSLSFLPSFNFNFFNAFFESISGFTTTGLTLYASLEDLPKSLILWRAETQWMGGIGIIMVFLFIISRLRFHAGQTAQEREAAAQTTAVLYQSQGFPEKLEGGLKKTIAHVLIIYGGYTCLGIFLLTVTGMPAFESIGLTFTSLSTGGFSVSDVLYTNSLQLAVLSLLMLLGSISFITHNKLLQRKFKEFILSHEKNVFIIFLLTGIALTFFVFSDAKIILFQLISAFTTTGYSITTISLLPHLFILIIILGMAIGGGIASTSGGIKVSRIYLLIKSVPWLIRKLSYPAHAVVPFNIRGKKVDEESLLIVASFVFLFISVLVVGTIILLLLGYNFLDSSFQVTSALGTAGLQTIPLLEMSWIGKLVLIIAMLLGRLEIFPLIILVRNIFKRR